MSVKAVKYNSTADIKVQVFTFAKGDENINLIGLSYISTSLGEKTKVTIKNYFKIKNLHFL